MSGNPWTKVSCGLWLLEALDGEVSLHSELCRKRRSLATACVSLVLYCSLPMRSLTSPLHRHRAFLRDRCVFVFAICCIKINVCLLFYYILNDLQVVMGIPFCFSLMAPSFSWADAALIMTFGSQWTGGQCGSWSLPPPDGQVGFMTRFSFL